MNEIDAYDILVLGGGKAGKTLAMDQAKAGKRVAVIEAGMIGGSCINIACIPTKALVRSAEVAETVRHAAVFGTDAGDDPSWTCTASPPARPRSSRTWSTSTDAPSRRAGSSS